jgi:hypothetical protein
MRGGKCVSACVSADSSRLGQGAAHASGPPLPRPLSPAAREKGENSNALRRVRGQARITFILLELRAYPKALSS